MQGNTAIYDQIGDQIALPGFELFKISRRPKLSKFFKAFTVRKTLKCDYFNSTKA